VTSAAHAPAVSASGLECGWDSDPGPLPLRLPERLKPERTVTGSTHGFPTSGGSHNNSARVKQPAARRLSVPVAMRLAACQVFVLLCTAWVVTQVPVGVIAQASADLLLLCFKFRRISKCRCAIAGPAGPRAYYDTSSPLPFTASDKLVVCRSRPSRVALCNLNIRANQGVLLTKLWH
jgi:hypothetical protein